MKKFLFTLFLLLILVFVIGTAIIAEVWIPGEEDDYQYPLVQLVESVRLKVGESYLIPDFLLGDNEKIDHVEISDPDILKVDGQSVTALGQFFSSNIQIFTSEKEAKGKPDRYQSVIIFGQDFTDLFNGYHDWVRDFLRIEEHQPERRELRILHIYEYDFEIEELTDAAIRKVPLGTVEAGSTLDLTVDLPENSFVSQFAIGYFNSHGDQFPAENGVRIEQVNDGYRLIAVGECDCQVSFFISRNKSLSSERHEAYVRYQQEHGYPVSEDPQAVEVPIMRIDFTVSVRQKKSEDNSNKGEKEYFTTSRGYSGYRQNGVTYIEGLLVVNKTYSLPSSYGKGLTSETQEAFNRMKKDAAKDGIKLSIVSGFRSYNYQVDLYNRYVKNEGKQQADSHSARPGHSEHQAGLAMDINSLSQSFDQTAEFAWLQANAWKYGFIMRYPKDSTGSTGYIYEPWHYRYVGEQWAEVFYNGGDWITVEDYFGITSRYSD